VKEKFQTAIHIMHFIRHWISFLLPSREMFDFDDQLTFAELDQPRFAFLCQIYDVPFCEFISCDSGYLMFVSTVG